MLTNRIFNVIKNSPIAELYLGCILRRYKSHRFAFNDADEDLKLLQSYSACPQGSSLYENNVASTKIYDLQIVVPVYNQQAYIRECVESIIGQTTKYRISIILVDDGSTDGCPAICDEYALSDKRVTVIHQKNGGLSSARNAAIRTLSARYLMFVDSDDRLADGAIDRMMDAAVSHNADIVQGDYRVIWNGIPASKVSSAKYGIIDSSSLFGFSWGKVFRSELFSDIRFPEGYWFEDSINSFLVYPKSAVTYAVPFVVYDYRENFKGISFTSKASPKSLDSFWITGLLIRERAKLGYPNDCRYMQKLIRQIARNHLRLQLAPQGIREAVFRLSSSLYAGVFPQSADKGLLSNREVLLDRIIRDGNFKLFSKISKWI